MLNDQPTPQSTINPIHTVDDLYEYIKNRMDFYHCEESTKEVIEQFLTSKLNPTTQATFFEALNERERNAIMNGELSLCYLILERRLLSSSFAKLILDKLEDATLNQQGKSKLTMHIDREVDTPLVMAVKGLSPSKRLNVDFNKDLKELLEWRDNLVYFLLQRNVNPDMGSVSIGYSLLEYCIWMSFSEPRYKELYYSVAEKILEKSTNVSIPNKAFGTTALHLAAAYGYEKMVKALLGKGADISKKAVSGLWKTMEKTPLQFATESNNQNAIHCVRLLLDAGASPNEMPSNLGQKLGGELDREGVLTPYQYAVDHQKLELVNLFKEFSNRKSIKLQTDLDPHEKRKRIPCIYRPQEHGHLEDRILVDAIRSQENLLSSIYETFKVRCYVENPDDRQAVTEALNWLLTSGTGVVSRYWDPIRLLFLNESCSNENLTIFVPRSYEYSGKYDHVTKNDIFLSGGYPAQAYKFLIAHELGHFFAARKTGGITVPEGFEVAYDNDKKRYDEGTVKPHALLADSLSEVDASHLYSSSNQRLAEYFTRACVEFPISLYLEQPTLSQDQFDQILEASMPNMLSYFTINFMAKEKALHQENPVKKLKLGSL